MTLRGLALYIDVRGTVNLQCFSCLYPFGDGLVNVWSVVAIGGLSMRFKGHVLFRSIGVGFAPNGYCNVVKTGNTNGSAFLHIVDGRLSPAHKAISLKPNRHLSMLDRSRFTFSRCAMVSAILVKRAAL